MCRSIVLYVIYNMKTCCECKETKELTEFCSNKRTKDGLNYACKKMLFIYKYNRDQCILNIGP